MKYMKQYGREETELADEWLREDLDSSILAQQLAKSQRVTCQAGPSEVMHDLASRAFLNSVVRVQYEPPRKTKPPKKRRQSFAEWLASKGLARIVEE